MKQIIICADDYSQNDAISEGILELAQNRRTNAISCLVNLPHWPTASSSLRPLQKEIYTGLHLNLTLGQALSNQWRKKYGMYFGGLGALIKKAYLRNLDQEVVMAELYAQLDVFANRLGINPDFIDGHQHIHQLPIIRDALLALYKQKNLTAFCRSACTNWQTLVSFSSFPKRQAIALLGGLRFNQLLTQHSIATNSSFAGIYNFMQAAHYRRYFCQFLQQSKPAGLIMCHPGKKSQDRLDPLHLYRHHEFNYLMSNTFLTDLREQQCQLMVKSL